MNPSSKGVFSLIAKIILSQLVAVEMEKRPFPVSFLSLSSTTQRQPQVPIYNTQKVGGNF